ncbi:MAG: NPCBM/NEW2 domain-containing protein [Planctomycetota bacterium]|nr:NPCBM/NEW2 domain-containing protein [Planctomycetaceae bacterium]MDQ3330357.1 NPCBM/NEW2 domain-containing protein [Planctomycetota bacterium]
MTRVALAAVLFAAAFGAARPKFESDVVTSSTPSHAVDVKADITGATSLYLVVTDGGDSFACDWADWIEPKLVGPKGEKKLMDLKWKSATSDWGKPHVGRNANGDQMRVAGQNVNGIGTHANSVIEYELPQGFTTFVAKGGLDEGGTNQSGGETTSVRFAVFTEKPTITGGRSDNASRELVDALAGIDVADDLEMTLFAGEPELKNPTSIDIDHRGRVWACEVVNYRQFRNTDSPVREAGDRILILEDTDHDAKADKTTVFYQGRDIDSAHGICVLGNKAIVSAGANVFVFTDANGDDQADTKELLFTGIGGTQHDHGIHAFAFGPDGRLYFNFGNEGHQLKDKHGKIVVDLAGNEVKADGKPYRQGMVFRCDLDGSNVETLGWNFRNNWEVAVDSFGTMWQSDNDDDGNRGVRINYVMEYGNYGYQDEMTGAGWQTPRTNMEAEIPLRHWHLNDPGVVPNVLQTGAGAPTGILVYEGDLLPERFRNAMIHADAGPNVVRAYPVGKDGAGYTATIENIAEGARDKWFRPSDVCVAPDGSLFIADWYDPGVGGHRMEDIERGRVFRVAPKGNAAKYVTPEADISSPEAAAKALTNPNLEIRYLAWTALQQAGEKAEPALKMLWQGDDPRTRARAIWLLGRLDGKGESYARQAISDENEDVRVTGLRLARQLSLKDKLELVPIIRELVEDDSPLVRRECAIALRQVDASSAAPLWTELIIRHDGKDRWYLEALGIAAEGRWDAFLSAWLKAVGEKWNTPAGRDIVWRSRSQQTPALLAKILLDPSVPESELPRYLRAFDFQPADAAQPVLIELAFGTQASDPRSQLIAAEALARVKNVDLHDPSKRKTLDALLENARGTKRFVELIEQFNLQDRDNDLVAIAMERPADEVGVAAIQSLLRRDRKEPIQKVLSGDQREQAAKLAEAIGNSAVGGSVGLLLPIIRDAKADSEVRRKAVMGLAKTRNGTERLIELAKNDQLDDSLKPAAAAALHAVTDAQLRATANELFPPPPGKDKPLPPISELAKRKGDANAGRLVYVDVGTCVKCHQFKGVGQNVGPDLSEIGDKLSREAFYESILYPSAGISHNYETYAAITNDGNVVTGLLVSKTPEEITLRASDAINRTFKMADIEEIAKQEVSLMPADLQKVLDEQQLIDLVEFLTTLKKAK